MRILYIHQYFSTNSGRTGTRSFAVVKRLADAGHEVTVLCGGSSASETELRTRFLLGWRKGTVRNFRVIEFSGAYSNHLRPQSRVIAWLWFALRSVAYVLFSKRYDVVFATSTPLTVALPAIVSKILRRSRMVFEVRDLWPDVLIEIGVLRNPFAISALRCLEVLAYRAADHVVTLAPGIHDRVAEVVGERSHVSTVTNGCDLDLFKPTETSLRRGRRNLEAPLVAGYSGTHGVANNLDFLVEVASELRSFSNAPVSIILIGEGSEKARLVSRSKNLGLNNLEFRDSVSRVELSTLVPNWDIGLQILADVSGFKNGTSPNKFFDYLSSGLPVITNYSGWVADFISRHKIGWVVDTPREMAELLVRLANSPEELQGCGARSRQCGEAFFNRDNLVDRLVPIIVGRNCDCRTAELAELEDQD